jgi:hypothetical protein
MNHVIAYELITAELDAYRKLSYTELSQCVGERESRLVRGHDGADYNVLSTVKLRSSGDIVVTVFVGEANWGGPHDSLIDEIIVSPPVGTQRATNT